MPRRTLRALAASALTHGIDPATPVVAVAEATRSGETVVRGTIADIAARLEAVTPVGPMLVMIGRLLGESASEAARGATRSDPVGQPGGTTGSGSGSAARG